MNTILTNTPRAGETAEQTAARSAPRGIPDHRNLHPKAKLAFLTNPGPGVFILNFQMEGRESVDRIEITKAQLGNIVVDGAGMAMQDASVRLGAESFSGGVE